MPCEPGPVYSAIRPVYIHPVLPVEGLFVLLLPDSLASFSPGDYRPRAQSSDRRHLGTICGVQDSAAESRLQVQHRLLQPHFLLGLHDALVAELARIPLRGLSHVLAGRPGKRGN